MSMYENNMPLSEENKTEGKLKTKVFYSNQSTPKPNFHKIYIIIGVILVIAIIIFIAFYFSFKKDKKQEKNNIVEKNYIISTYKTEIGQNIKIFNPTSLGLNEKDFTIYEILDDSKNIRRLGEIVSKDGYFTSNKNGLTKIKIKFFVNLNNLDFMFETCEDLVNVDLSNLETSKVTSMIYAFNGCKNMEKINITSLNTSNVKLMDFLFAGCNNLVDIIGLETLDTSSLKKTAGMFLDCNSLIYANLSSFQIDNIEEQNGMFVNTPSLKVIDLSNSTNNSNTSQIFSPNEEFNIIIKGQDINLTNFNGSFKVELSFEVEEINCTIGHGEKCMECSDKKGEKIKCKSCNVGYYLPLGTEFSKTKCKKCEEGCNICYAEKGEDLSKCLICNDSYQLFEGKCIKNCEIGQNEKCTECDINGYNDRCKKCNEGFYFDINYNKSICRKINIENCIEAELESNNLKCIKCTEGFIVYENLCFKSCVIGDKEKCSSCNPNFDYREYCNSCNSGYYLNKTDPTKCSPCFYSNFNNSQYEYYENNTSNISSSLNESNCKECDLISGQLKCTFCQEGYTLINNTCFKNCDKGCSNCFFDGNSKGQCTKCKDGYLLKTVNYYYNYIESYCEPCPIGCKECYENYNSQNSDNEYYSDYSFSDNNYNFATESDYSDYDDIDNSQSILSDDFNYISNNIENSDNIEFTDISNSDNVEHTNIYSTYLYNQKSDNPNYNNKTYQTYINSNKSNNWNFTNYSTYLKNSDFSNPNYNITLSTNLKNRRLTENNMTNSINCLEYTICTNTSYNLTNITYCTNYINCTNIINNISYFNQLNYSNYSNCYNFSNCSNYIESLNNSNCSYERTCIFNFSCVNYIYYKNQNYYDNGKYCKSCINGFNLVNNFCEKQCDIGENEKCLTCEEKVFNRCASCNKNYYINSEKGTCHPCEVNKCIKCNKNSECLECETGYELISNKCYKTCEKGLNEKCKECKNINSNEKGECNSCNMGYYLPIDSKDKSKCSPCSYGCLSCYGNETTSVCNKCKEHFSLINGRCKIDDDDICPQPYIKSGKFCMEKCIIGINEKCYSCNDEETKIDQCKECNIGYYLPSDSDKKKCKMCEPYCLSCNGTQLKSNCIKCQENYMIYEGGCVKNCQIGDKDKCKTCNENPGFNYRCSSCNDGYYLPNLESDSFNHNSKCQKCPDNCKKCSGNYNEPICNECNESYFSKNNKCIEGCPIIKEKYNCQECDDKDEPKCTKCKEGFYLPKEEKEKGISKCYKCNNLGCIDCEGNIDNNHCLKCKNDLNPIIDNNGSIISCYNTCEIGENEKCKSCSDEENKCFDCNKGYHLDNGECHLDYYTFTATYISTYNNERVKLMNNYNTIVKMEVDGNIYNYPENYFTFKNPGDHKVNIRLGGYSFADLFYGITQLKSITFWNNFDSTQIGLMNDFFYGCINLEYVDMSRLNLKNNHCFMNFFKGDKKLETVIFPKTEFYNIYWFYCMFEGCESLTSIDMSTVHNDNGGTFYNMFKGCTKLTKINLKNFKKTCQNCPKYDLFTGVPPNGEIIISHEFDPSMTAQIPSTWEKKYEDNN